MSGLTIKIDTEDVHEGGSNHTTRKIVKHTSYGNVTLKRGLVDRRFFSWITDILNGNVYRKEVIISVLDEKGNPSMSYKLLNALPVQWKGADLNVMQDTIATESLEIAIEGMVIA